MSCIAQAYSEAGDILDETEDHKGEIKGLEIEEVQHVENLPRIEGIATNLFFCSLRYPCSYRLLVWNLKQLREL